MRTLTLLGSTGSIGTQTLEVLKLHPQDFSVYALVAQSSWEKLATQCLEYRPRYAVLSDHAAAVQLRNHLQQQGSETLVLAGSEAIDRVAAAADITVAGIVGAAGVGPTLAAVNAGRRVLLANKEALVVTGRIFMDAAARSGAEIIPVDSEHSAIFQCLPPPGKARLKGVEKLVLTASGGPFRQLSAAALARVTPAEAVRHPNWSMGAKISVDSATLMNKGLELIEACYLFGVTEEQVEVVIHPQSIIHSMVRYRDGSVLAQLGVPDMRTPVALGLSWPERCESGARQLDFCALGQLEFEAPDTQRFPCLQIAREALRQGGTTTAVLNAANEVAVAAFLQEQLRFVDIPAVIAETLSRVAAPHCDDVADVMAVDADARRTSEDIVKKIRGRSC